MKNETEWSDQYKRIIIIFSVMAISIKNIYYKNYIIPL